MNDELRVTKLVKGVGNPETGGCWMAALTMYTGQEWSDHPDCVCPVVQALCIRINDMLPSDAERARLIGPRLYDPIGTALQKPGEPLHPDTIRRAFLCADRAVRVFAATPKNGLADLDPIVDEKSALAARAAAAAYTATYAARVAANAAANAAFAAADAADYDAAACAVTACDSLFALLDDVMAIGDTRPVERVPMACEPTEFCKTFAPETVGAA
ncbi:MAG: hypothetical protein RIB60_06170 [Phycisphaerales bacterium]